MIGSWSKSYIGWYQWDVKVDLRSRWQGQISRSNMRFCKKKTCFDNTSWTNDWILMILKHIIDNRKILKFTQGQGHKVKAQGQICTFVEKNILTVYHEPMIGYWWYSHTWLITIKFWSLRKFEVTSQSSRSNMQFCKIRVSTMDHEPMIG